MDDRPIGMFDSGFGGLTVLRALIERLPHARFAFLGDTARLPYGSKSRRTNWKRRLRRLTKFRRKCVPGTRLAMANSKMPIFSITCKA